MQSPLDLNLLGHADNSHC